MCCLVIGGVEVVIGRECTVDFLCLFEGNLRLLYEYSLNSAMLCDEEITKSKHRRLFFFFFVDTHYLHSWDTI
jgi:hypothetical protein